MHLSCLFFNLGFYEDNEHYTFGIIKKKSYRPLSDFNFYFLMKVACRRSVSTGYLVRVIPEATAQEEIEELSRYSLSI